MISGNKMKSVRASGRVLRYIPRVKNFRLPDLLILEAAGIFFCFNVFVYVTRAATLNAASGHPLYSFMFSFCPAMSYSPLSFPALI